MNGITGDKAHIIRYDLERIEDRAVGKDIGAQNERGIARTSARLAIGRGDRRAADPRFAERGKFSRRIGWQGLSPKGNRTHNRGKTALNIVLIGNPNAGKTTLFNALTHSYRKTGNWHGVTVDAFSKTVRRGGLVATVTDAPGVYSL